MIPTDGSTIDVLIDNVPVGHPTYGFARADIDAPRLHQQRRRRSVLHHRHDHAVEWAYGTVLDMSRPDSTCDSGSSRLRS
jgi:hypothetical protein